MSFKYFLTAICLCLLLVSAALAEVPQMINYHGKITTPQGTLIDTTISMTFTIYTDSIGTDSLWSETQSSVVVEKGIFSVLLGSVTPIPDSVFTGETRYLGVKAGNDSEMTPRKAIVSVGYAYKAEYADTSDYAQAAASDGDWTPDTAGINIYRLTGNVGIGTAAPDGKLVITGMAVGVALKIKGSGSTSYFHNDASGLHIKSYDDSNLRAIKFHTGSDWTPEMVIQNNGNIGIGVAYPAYKLDVDGDINVAGSYNVKKGGVNYTHPDYVFEPDYQLMSLDQLKKYVFENKSLPDVISAEDVKKNKGFKMDELLIQMLEKTEEQTLYIFQLEERIAELERGK